MVGKQTEGRRGNPENLNPQFAQLTHALAGIDLPQDKSGLKQYAEENGADDEIVSLIDRLPEDEYETMADVVSAASDAGNEE